LFELGVLEEFIEVQDWRKFEQKRKNITDQLEKVMVAVEKAAAEIKADFNL